MRHRSICSGAFAAIVAATVLTAGSAEAAFQDLGDSGWRVTYGEGLNIAFLGVTGDRAEVKIQKIAQFTEPFNGDIGPVLQLQFEQRSFNATSYITIDSEAVTNQTGSDWSSFNFIIDEAGSGSTVKFDETKTFGDDDPFNIQPFDNFAFNGDLTQLTVSGGAGVKNGETWLPGSGSGAGELVIFGAPVSSGTLKSFNLDEQPGGPTIIPLPAASWSGLAGLLALGLTRYAKKLRQLIA